MPKGIPGSGPADPVPTAEERFWAKVDKTRGGCWSWMAGRDGDGYGMFWLDGQNRRAHRVVWQLLVGSIPDDRKLDHLCRNPPCVKVVADEFGPAHLELVTARENVLRGPDDNGSERSKDAL